MAGLGIAGNRPPQRCQRLRHPGAQLERPAIHDEAAVALMVDGSGMFLGRISPRLQHLEHEQVVTVHEPRIVPLTTAR
jgi:hypothetical protein